MKFEHKYAREILKRLQQLKRSQKRNSLVKRIEAGMRNAENNGSDLRNALAEAEDYLEMY